MMLLMMLLTWLQDVDPVLTMTTQTDPYEVGLFHAVKYYLDVELPENSITDYMLEVTISIYGGTGNSVI